jgi:hypothetical protein
MTTVPLALWRERGNGCEAEAFDPGFFASDVDERDDEANRCERRTHEDRNRDARAILQQGITIVVCSGGAHDGTSGDLTPLRDASASPSTAPVGTLQPDSPPSGQGAIPDRR